MHPLAMYMARPGWKARRVGLGVFNSHFRRRRLSGGEETASRIVEVRIIDGYRSKIRVGVSWFIQLSSLSLFTSKTHLSVPPTKRHPNPNFSNSLKRLPFPSYNPQPRQGFPHCHRTQLRPPLGLTPPYSLQLTKKPGLL